MSKYSVTQIHSSAGFIPFGPSLASYTALPLSGGANPVTAVFIALPPKTFVVISGTARGTRNQRVTINQSMVDDLTPLASTYMTGNYDTNAVFNAEQGGHAITLNPVDATTNVVIIFEMKKSSKSDWEYTKLLATDYNITSLQTKGGSMYLFHTEDGGDSDLKDSNVVVSFIDLAA
ncbi:hypothetical protein C8Q75DRAFT_806016 [Abortiporus biennis]|nr:hypothetical protein C8Q75DRAFT_806016 [Abortiporus biennis]